MPQTAIRPQNVVLCRGGKCVASGHRSAPRRAGLSVNEMFRNADQGGRIHRHGLGKHSVNTAPESRSRCLFSRCLFIDQTRNPVSREIRHHSVAHLPTFDLRSKLGDFTGTVGQRDDPRSVISRISLVSMPITRRRSTTMPRCFVESMVHRGVCGQAHFRIGGRTRIGESFSRRLAGETKSTSAASIRTQHVKTDRDHRAQ